MVGGMITHPYGAQAAIIGIFLNKPSLIIAKDGGGTIGM